MDAPGPTILLVLPGIFAIDTRLAGEDALNAVYLLSGSEPCLVEAGPETDGPRLRHALELLGVGSADLAHIVVTHIHMDHAGGVGELLQRFPRARVWVHERGAPHLADPARLLASTARTYGAEQLARLYGGMRGCDPERIRAVTDDDLIPLGDRHLRVLYTPGHASHHVALHDSATGALCTGEAIGSYLPWADSYRPAMPPPEADPEVAISSIERMRALRPSALLTSHFGPTPDVDEGFERSVASIRRWSDAVAQHLREDPSAADDAIDAALHRLAAQEFRSDAGRPLAPELARYDALGSIRMNAQGLARYWRKRWQRDGAETGAAPLS